jgi:hypothetical protein
MPTIHWYALRKRYEYIGKGTVRLVEGKLRTHYTDTKVGLREIVTKL